MRRLKTNTASAYLTLFLVFAAVLTVWAQTWGPKAYGILLLGHGGSSEWNQSLHDVKQAVTDQKIPIEMALGMADPTEIQPAVDKLQQQQVKKIVVVPLFVSSHSEVIEQTKYVLGIRKIPSEEFVNAPHAHMANMTVKRARLNIPLVMAPALDDHPLVADILLDRAKAMSRNPSKEYVILVGHGPLKEEDNELWLKYMDNLARAVQTHGGFAGVFSATIRDDSPPDVRQKADKILRDMVSRYSHEGRVLVVPDLISSGGIERHISKILDGLFYSWTGKTLLPDPRITRWVIESAQKASNLQDMRQFKDEGRPLPPPGHKHIMPLDQPTRSSYGN